MLNRCRCSSYSTHDEVYINVSCEFNSTESDIFCTYFVKNKLEVIRRLTSWLVFCRDYGGSTSRREVGYFINNGAYRSAAGLTRPFWSFKFLIGWYKCSPSLYQWVEIIKIWYTNILYFYKPMQLLLLSRQIFLWWWYNLT